MKRARRSANAAPARGAAQAPPRTPVPGRSRGPSRAAALAAVFLFSCAAVFGGGRREEEQVLDTGEMIEISWLAQLPDGAETTWCMEEIRRRFNARIVPNGIDTNDSDQVAAMLAADQFPDVGAVFSNWNELYEQGIHRAFSKELIMEYAPAYTKRLNEDVPMGWFAARSPENPEEYIGILDIRDSADTNVWHVAFRADWARHVGVALEGYDENKIPLDEIGRVYFWDTAFSLERLEDLLTAFRDGDPDRNGADDTISWGANRHKDWTWQPILGAYGLAHDYNVDHNGRLYDYAVAPAYKDFLKLAAKWYADGLLAADFNLLDLRQTFEQVKNRRIGALNVAVRHTGLPWAAGYPPNSFASVEAVSEGAEVVVIPPPVGPDGRQGAGAYFPVGPVGPGRVSIGAEVTDAKLARILRILDWLRYADAEGWVFAHAGAPGVHFDWQGEPWESMAVPAEEPKFGGFPSLYPAVHTKDRFAYLYPDPLADFYVNYLLAEKGQSRTIRPHRSNLTNEAEELRRIRKEYGAVLDAVRNAFYTRAITGEVDIDAAWDDYVSAWMAAGGRELLDEYEKVPLVSGLREGKLLY